jgi:lysophospholipase L1-like esterase
MLRDELMKGEKYDAVSILAGGNDAWRDDPRAAIDNLKSMYQTIKNAGMKVIAVSNPTKKFAESPGSSKKKYPSNDEIASWVEAGGDGLIDSIVPLNSRTKDTLTAFSGDKIHLSGAGHAVAKSLWKESALA